MKGIIYISVTNDVITDQRVQRIAESLSMHDLSIKIIGRKFSGSDIYSSDKYKVHRFQLLVNKGFLFYACFNFRLFFYLLSRLKIKALVANDLDTLLPNYLVSRLRRVPLIYDSHEYFTEVPELTDRAFVKSFWLFLEKRIVPGIRFASTVNDSLASIYEMLYGTKFEVIRNLPLKNPPIEEFEIPEWISGKRVVLYQGAVNMARGIETVIEAVREMKDVVFIIAGTGDCFEKIKNYIKTEELGDRVYMTGRLDPARLKSLTRQAHLGVSLELNLSLNYYYALPNKLFDYIQAGIPVLVSSFPEMRTIVEKYGTGLVVDSSDIKQIKQLIYEMLHDDQKRSIWISNSVSAREELNWENEQKRLIQLYVKAGIIPESLN